MLLAQPTCMTEVLLVSRCSSRQIRVASAGAWQKLSGNSNIGGFAKGLMSSDASQLVLTCMGGAGRRHVAHSPVGLESLTTQHVLKKECGSHQILHEPPLLL